MISIIIPLYNKEREISRTLDSILAQIVSDFEIIVVDDGSKDKSAEIVRGYTDSRIRYIQKENGGVSSARNRGIKEAQGEWLLFLDGDDVFEKNAFEVFKRLIKFAPTCKLLVGGIRTIQKGIELSTSTYRKNKVKVTRCPYFTLWLNRFYPRPGATLVHHSLIEQYGSFDERMSFFEDYEFGWRMLQCGNVAYTGEPVMIYVQDEGGLSFSTHPIEKEMAYYIPQIKTHGFFSKALLYENLEFVINWWPKNSSQHAYYKALKSSYFKRYHATLHWIRQKLVNKGLI